MNKTILFSIVVLILLVGGGWFAYSQGFLPDFKSAPGGMPENEDFDVVQLFDEGADPDKVVATVNDNQLKHSDYERLLTNMVVARGISTTSLDAFTAGALKSEALDILIEKERGEWQKDKT